MPRLLQRLACGPSALGGEGPPERDRVGLRMVRLGARPPRRRARLVPGVSVSSGGWHRCPKRRVARLRGRGRPLEPRPVVRAILRRHERPAPFLAAPVTQRGAPARWRVHASAAAGSSGSSGSPSCSSASRLARRSRVERCPSTVAAERSAGLGRAAARRSWPMCARPSRTARSMRRVSRLRGAATTTLATPTRPAPIARR